MVAGTYGNVTLEGPGVDQWPEIPEEPGGGIRCGERCGGGFLCSRTDPTPASTPEVTPEPEQTEGGLSGGAIAGIVIVIVVILAAGIVVYKKCASKSDK